MKNKVLENSYVDIRGIDHSQYNYFSIYFKANVNGYKPLFYYGLDKAVCKYDNLEAHHEYVKIADKHINQITQKRSAVFEYLNSFFGMNMFYLTADLEEHHYLNANFVLDSNFNVLFAVYVDSTSDMRVTDLDNAYLDPDKHYCVYIDPAFMKDPKYRKTFSIYKKLYEKLSKNVHNRIVMMHKSNIKKELIYNPDVDRNEVNSLIDKIFGKQEQN